MKGRQDLGRAPIPRLVLGLAVPAMIAQFVNVLYSLIDRVYIGNIPAIGDLALAGVGVCGPIVTLLSSFGTLVGLGGSILMAIRLGEGDNEAARRVLAMEHARPMDQLEDELRQLGEHGYREVVLTGRNPPALLADRADYITEMRKLRHPFDQGIRARRGIEF